MPSIEEREGKISEEMAAIMLEHERGQFLTRPPARADHSRERDALAERLRQLKGRMEPLDLSPAGTAKMCDRIETEAIRLGMLPPKRDPIYKDDIPYR